jgi:serine/threonine protein kinase/tetratricopeptide (TPR) repeat protein
MPSPDSRIDHTCDRFEAQWRAGSRPSIEAFLARAPASDRPGLLDELLRVELELLRARGEEPREEDYRERFGEHLESVRSAFGTALPDVDSRLVLRAVSGALPGRDAPPGTIGPPLASPAIAAGRAGAAPNGTAAAGPGRRPPEPGANGHPPDGPTTLSLALAPTDPPSAARGPSEGPALALDARFRILHPHAQGGLGAIYVARDGQLRRDVALKEIQDRYADDPESRARFLREARITGRLEHPGIVPVYALGRHPDGRPYYAMRLVNGKSLKDAIVEFHDPKGSGRDPVGRRLALRQLLGRFLDVCNAVAYAHSRGVIHRDLKPENIMLGPYGETLVVDWGMAKVIGAPWEPDRPPDGEALPSDLDGDSVPLRTGSVLGTPAYMSPEQAAGRLDQLGPAGDVYSLGATLYCLLTGGAPFRSRDLDEALRGVQRGDFRRPRQVDRRVPPALEAICLKAMALAPGDRYRSPRDLAEDLEHWLGDEPVSAYREWGPQRLARWARRHRPRTRTGAALLLLMTVVQVGGTFLLIGQWQDRALAGARRRQEFLAQYADAHYFGTLLADSALPADSVATWGASQRALDLLATIDDPDAEMIEARDHLLLLLAEAVDALNRRGGIGGPTFGDPLTILSRVSPRGQETRAFHWRRGDLLARRGDRRGAEQERLWDASRAPASAFDHFLQGQEWYRRGALPPAIREFKAVLDVQPDHFWALFFLGLCHLGSQDPADAEIALTACIARRPDLSWAYILRGSARGEQGEFEAAEADFQRALGLVARHQDGPALYVIYVDRGVMRIRQKEYQKAIDDLRQAIRLRPDQYQAYVNLARVYQEQQRFDEAEEQLDEAMWVGRSGADPIAPFRAALDRGRARQERVRHDWPAALRSIDRAIRLDHRDRAALAEDHRERGSILLDIGRFQEAIGACDAALAFRDDDPAVLRVRAEALLGLGSYAEAARACDRYLERFPPVADVLRIRGRARVKLGDPAGGLEDYSWVLALRPKNADILVHRGEAYGNCGAWELALRDYEEAVRRDPTSSDASNGRGYARVRLGRYREAVADAEVALRLDPKSPEMMYNVACTLALGAGQAEADVHQPDHQVLATRYRDRALQVLDRALNLLPAAQRPSFWRDTVRMDPDMDPIRHCPGFVALEAVYSEGIDRAEPRKPAPAIDPCAP